MKVRAAINNVLSSLLRRMKRIVKQLRSNNSKDKTNVAKMQHTNKTGFKGKDSSIVRKNIKTSDIDEITYHKISSLCEYRLKRSVSEYDVVKWLQNFSKHEYSKALKILTYLDVYTESEIIEFWDDRLSSLLTEIDNNADVLIMPVAEYGKSGTLMMYYLKKSPCYRNNEIRIKIYPTQDVLKHKKKGNAISQNSVLVLVDDFIGSGKSMEKFYRTYIKPQIEGYDKIIFLYSISLFAIDKGVNYLHRIAPELNIITEKKARVFGSGKSVFGYYKSMKPIRDFCYKYGSELFNIKGTPWPLGYENSQALVIFPYSPPNNSLPILWSNKNHWSPLYPRSVHYRVSDAKAARKRIASYISMIEVESSTDSFKTGRKDLGWKNVHFVTKTDFQSFAVMYLMRKRRAEVVIQQILGITSKDYQKIIADLKEKEVVNDDMSFTEYGEDIYFSVLKGKRRVKEKIKSITIDDIDNKSIYLPLQFRGASISN